VQSRSSSTDRPLEVACSSYRQLARARGLARCLFGEMGGASSKRVASIQHSAFVSVRGAQPGPSWRRVTIPTCGARKEYPTLIPEPLTAGEPSGRSANLPVRCLHSEKQSTSDRMGTTRATQALP